MTKVVFFGKGNFVEPVIKILKNNFELVQVGEKADIGVIASYGKIIPKSVIDSFSYGILNIHPSLLPKYRGPTPVQTAILNGDKKTGVTIIKIDEEVDHGSILAQKEIEISDNETSETLLKKTFEIGAKMLSKVISNYIKGEIKISPQDDSKASFTQILTRQNGFIDLNSLPALEFLGRMIRAYYPWPGVWFKTHLGGKEKVIKLLPDKKIQVEGKKSMAYEDFVNGYPEGKIVLDKLDLLD